MGEESVRGKKHMFHKRLLKEFRDNQKYVAGMVAAQWGILLANVILMLAAADFIGDMRTGSLETAGIWRILLILAAVLLFCSGGS